MASMHNPAGPEEPFIATSHERTADTAHLREREGRRSGDLHPPRAPRRRTLIGATMRGKGMAEQDVIVRNVSRTGMCIAAHDPLPRPGAAITITLTQTTGAQGKGQKLREHRGRVRWVDAQSCGVELVEELDIGELGRSTMRRNHALAETLDWRIEERYGAGRHPDSLQFCV